MGMGHPDQMVRMIGKGIDMFDCVMPTRNGRNGMLFTSEGIINLLIDISKNGRAVLMASHDFMMIEKFPSRTLRCENGKVLSEN